MPPYGRAACADKYCRARISLNKSLFDTPVGIEAIIDEIANHQSAQGLARSPVLTQMQNPIDGF
jgi:hypothetical protein